MISLKRNITINKFCSSVPLAWMYLHQEVQTLTYCTRYVLIQTNVRSNRSDQKGHENYNQIYLFSHLSDRLINMSQILSERKYQAWDCTRQSNLSERVEPMFLNNFLVTKRNCLKNKYIIDHDVVGKKNM